MKILAHLFLILCCCEVHAEPEQYMKKEDIKTSAVSIGDKTYFTFGFKDIKGSYKEWSWSNNTEKIKSLSRAFGLYNKNPKNFTYYDNELPEAMYKEHFTMGVLPDYSALVNFYQDSVVDLYTNWKYFSESGKLTQRESLELLLRFFQDFPYGVPPTTLENRLISGLFVPPLVFKNGWADCDSKALLMATVLSHDAFYHEKLAMILVPGHALLGLNIRPQAYDDTYSNRNIKYVVAEPTGLGRTPLGRRNSPYDKVLAIEPIIINKSAQAVGSTSTSPAGQNLDLKILTSDDCTDGAILVDYVSAVQNARIQMCQIKEAGKYLKHGPELIFNSKGQPVTKSIYNKGTKL